MAIKIQNQDGTPAALNTPAPAAPAAPSKPKVRRTNGHQKPLPVSPAMLDNPLARLRTGHVMWLLSLSASALAERIKRGEFPEPTGYDGPLRVWKAGQAPRGRPYWQASTVKDFLSK